ncbi:MAG: Choline dehydrogenase-like flavoprotein [Acidimicrobiales bacterium]|nr:Choline dehydrogenase-like flavoprotein [Acidimicrobiales bacterium]
MTDADCDVIVIGSGPGGATAADVLTAAGWSVIVLEKGRNHLVDLAAPYAPLRHLANDEIALVRRHLLGPDPLLEPRTYRRTTEDGERLSTGEVNNLPSTVGGGGFHADAKLPRFREEDFALRSTRGPVDGADVRDWPFGYDELEPHYAAVERIIGVAGEEGNPFAAWRSSGFPMPPGPDMPMALVTSAAAERAGLHPYRAPTGANSVEYDGRPACVDCGFCGRYGCPIAAKGDPIASLQRMLRTGRGTVVPEAYVTEIVRDAAGRRATGVRYLDLTRHPDAPEVELRASRAVVVAGGAFETARLLLRNGLGGDLVGRHLTYHFQTFTVGIFADDTGGDRGRDVTHLHDDFMIDTPGLRDAAREAGLPWLRGGVTEHGSAAGPVDEAAMYPPGKHHARAMADSSLRRRLWVLTMQGEDLARPDNRIDLDPSVRDAWGFPAGRVTYSPHRHELAASSYAAAIHEAILSDAGAQATFSATSPPQDQIELHAEVNPIGIAPASRHVMGTARMGDDPATSVVSPEQRLWDVDNVLVCDSSVFVTSTGYNPTLTLAALAHRAATLLAGPG